MIINRLLLVCVLAILAGLLMRPAHAEMCSPGTALSGQSTTD